MYSHAYERIWLWERYNMAVTTHEDGKQNEILPYENREGGSKGMKNKHLDRVTGEWGGPLHYDEFMVRLSGNEIRPGEALPKFTLPSVSLEEAAKSIVENRFSKNLALDQIDPKSGNSGGGKSAQARQDARYQQIFTKLEKQLATWRKDDKIYAKIKSRDESMKTLNDRIVQLRQEDKERFFISYFEKTPDPKKGIVGLNLKGHIKKDSKASLVPGGPEYERINLGKTWEASKEAIKKSLLDNYNIKIKKFETFERFVTQLGDPDGKYFEKSKVNPSHFHTLQMWTHIKDKKLCG